jgi:gamma-glutamyl-gamma-aminobutyrate hydrolase PuuD
MDYDDEPERHRAFLNVAYLEAVDRASGIPVPLAPLTGDSLVEALGSLDGLVLTGGRDLDPRHYGAKAGPKTSLMPRAKETSDLELARLALDGGLPVLGACMGIQLMNVVLGGTLVQDLATERPGPVEHASTGGVGAIHAVAIEPGTALARIMGPGQVQVNSRHHQAIDRLGRGLVACAKSADGLVEAVEVPGPRFALAVQWHPEDMTDRPEHLALFQALVRAAAGP